jgi:hypothetical protein
VCRYFWVDVPERLRRGHSIRDLIELAREFKAAGISHSNRNSPLPATEIRPEEFPGDSGVTLGRLPYSAGTSIYHLTNFKIANDLAHGHGRVDENLGHGRILEKILSKFVTLMARQDFVGMLRVYRQ